MTAPGNAVGLGPVSRTRFRWLAGFCFIACLLLAVLWYRGTKPATAPPVEVPGEGLSGDPEIAAAIETARAAVIREPSSAAAWGNLGQILHVHNLVSPALACYEKAEQLANQDARWPYLRGVILSNGQDPKLAIPHFRRAAELGLEKLPQFRLGELFLDQGDFDQAASTLDLLLAKDPNSQRLQLDLARQALARGDAGGCLRQLDAMGDVPAARRRVCSLRLAAYRKLGDEPAAGREQLALAQLSDDPPWPDPLLDQLLLHEAGLRARIRQARELVGNGAGQAALTLLIRTVCDYPDAEEAWTTLGRTMAVMRESAIAKECYLKSVELAPGRVDLWLSLGQLRQDQKEYARAIDDYRKAIQLQPVNAEAHFKMGRCFEEMGDRASAIEAYRRALHDRPGFPAAQEHLAALQGNTN